MEKSDKEKIIYQVDAFTDELFKGNPAGVMFCDTFMAPELMQNIAMEMNLSETAFITPDSRGFQIRYFTPVKEVPLCGHATLASAHIIYKLGLIELCDTIFLKAKDAELTVNWNDGWITMNFPRYPLKKIDIPVGFKEIIGFEPVETYSSSYDWIVAVADSETDIKQVKPDFEKMLISGLGHLMITVKSDSEQADFVVRCFAPFAGINEDPVTGSAHCALTPLWSKKLNKLEMNSLQLSKRTGKLKVKMAGNDRVEISGKAITVFEAKLKI
ncbi:MAG: PhzF family phenazine biosynthesis protein [Candidatus Azobacteroides sp.]|nr:PhzF family phenazine biosynthesis protein [Candidatus Azobacteroides sp.]